MMMMMKAFCNKISRQTIFTNKTMRILPVLGVQMLIPIRNLSSSTKLFVGGLSFGTDDQQLKEAFSSFGNVTYAQVILNRDTGKSRGFGFVKFENIADANTALSGLDGQDLNGRKLSISYASDDRRPGLIVNRGTGVYEGGSGSQGQQ